MAVGAIGGSPVQCYSLVRGGCLVETYVGYRRVVGQRGYIYKVGWFGLAVVVDGHNTGGVGGGRIQVLYGVGGSCAIGFIDQYAEVWLYGVYPGQCLVSNDLYCKQYQ